MIILIPLAALSLFTVVGDVFPKLPGLKAFEEYGFGIEKIEASKHTTANIQGNKGFLISTIWILFFTISIIYLGFLLALLLSTFLFFKFAGHSKWVDSIFFAAILTAINYLFAEIVLGFTLFEGLLFGGMILF